GLVPLLVVACAAEPSLEGATSAAPAKDGDAGTTAPPDTGDAAAPPASVPASAFNATPAVAWMDLVYDRVRAEKRTPPAAARAYAYDGIAIYEAIVAGAPDRRSLAGQIAGYAAAP